MVESSPTFDCSSACCHCYPLSWLHSLSQQKHVCESSVVCLHWMIHFHPSIFLMTRMRQQMPSFPQHLAVWVTEKISLKACDKHLIYQYAITKNFHNQVNCYVSCYQKIIKHDIFFFFLLQIEDHDLQEQYRYRFTTEGKPTNEMNAV